MGPSQDADGAFSSPASQGHGHIPGESERPQCKTGGPAPAGNVYRELVA